ncbi:hypothetical protein BH18THE1_BH18THE1_10370 [soil metagenome]
MIFLVIRLPEKREIVLDVEKEFSWQSTKKGIPVANADLLNLNKSQNNFKLVTNSNLSDLFRYLTVVLADYVHYVKIVATTFFMY